MNRSNSTAAPTKARARIASAIPRDDQARKARVAEDDSVFAEAMKRYTEAQDYLLQFFKAPTWKRTLVAFVTSIVVAAGVGFAADSILTWMVTGAVAMAAPTFLIAVTWVIGFFLALYYGGKLAARIGGAVLTGEADERALAAYDAVRAKLAKWNPFGAREIVAAKGRAHA